MVFLESGFPAVIADVNVRFGLVCFERKLDAGVISTILLGSAGYILTIESDFFEVTALEINFICAWIDSKRVLISISGLRTREVFGGFLAAGDLFGDD